MRICIVQGNLARACLVINMSRSKFSYVTELTEPPKPGVRYMVPLVWVEKGDLPTGWWPVTGPQHEDKEHINFEHQHWHPDLRFLTDAQLVDLTELYGSFQTWELYHEGAVGTYKAHTRALLALYVRRVVVRPRLCRRPQPVYPRSMMGFYWLRTLERAYQDQVLRGCQRCPHRGVPLGNLPRDDQGRVVCPAHGLRWDLGTGRLCPMTDRE